MDGPMITILNNESATPKENTNITLSCNIGDNRLYGNTVTYEWTKDGDSNIILANTTTFAVMGIKRSDSGSYRCTAKVEVFSFHKQAVQNLTVYCKLQWFISPLFYFCWMLEVFNCYTNTN